MNAYPTGTTGATPSDEMTADEIISASSSVLDQTSTTHLRQNAQLVSIGVSPQPVDSESQTEPSPDLRDAEVIFSFNTALV